MSNHLQNKQLIIKNSPRDVKPQRYGMRPRKKRNRERKTMKRTDITDLFPDAPKETIDKIMDLNGADVNAVRAEVEDLRKQLTEAQKYKGADEELQKAQQQISQLTSELNGMKTAETIRLTREKVSGEKKVPVHLLTGETEEACAKQADLILAFKNEGGYPQIPDGGEPSNPPNTSTRDRFAAFMSDKI